MQYRVYYANDLYNGQKQIDLSDDLDFCLSGTAEMGIANQLTIYFNKYFNLFI